MSRIEFPKRSNAEGCSSSNNIHLDFGCFLNDDIFRSIEGKLGGVRLTPKRKAKRGLCASKGSVQQGSVKAAVVRVCENEISARPSLEKMISHPISFVGLVPAGAALFVAGALAGSLAKTVSCPLDRVKILLQVKGGAQSGLIQQAALKGSVVQTFLAIGKQEGLAGYFKGNIPQVIRAIPYDAVRLTAYEVLKEKLRDSEGNLSVPARLCAGAMAGMTSTAVTYPLDTIRFRMAVDPAARSIPQVVGSMLKNEGVLSLYKGLGTSLAGIAPYIAINFATFDILKKNLPEDMQKNTTASLATAFMATTLATTCCYPLDTLRRQMQLQSSNHANVFAAFAALSAQGGPFAVYRGFLPNMLKNLPTNSVRLAAFDTAKRIINDGNEVYADLLAEELAETQGAAC